jgi:hypothetical protein
LELAIRPSPEAGCRLWDWHPPATALDAFGLEKMIQITAAHQPQTEMTIYDGAPPDEQASPTRDARHQLGKHDEQTKRNFELYSLSKEGRRPRQRYNRRHLHQRERSCKHRRPVDEPLRGSSKVITRISRAMRR